MLPLNLSELKREDFEQLITNGVRESKTIEYKRELPGNSDSDKKEFLADVSSFANSGGGDLAYGMECEDGLPVKLVGIEIENIDATILKYESITKDGLAPRIACEIIPVELETNKYALVIRVLPSWNPPHRVVYKGHDKFYARNSAGKYSLDVDELRSLFTYSLLAEEKINNFIGARITNIFINELPFRLIDGPKMVLHVAPFDSFKSRMNHHIYDTPSLVSRLRPMMHGGHDYRINLEGYFSYASDADGNVGDYAQLFRNGIIESVNWSSLVFQEKYGTHGKKMIPGLAYEQRVIESLGGYLQLLRDVGVNLPVTISLAFVNCKGYTLGTKSLDESYPCDRDILRFPEVVITEWNKEPSKIMLPIFNTVWNAFGYSRSYNFTEEGKWIEK